MIRVVLFNPVGHESLKWEHGISPVNHATLTSASVDEHLLALDDADGVRARCSLWYRDTPSISEQTAGLIGHYVAADVEAGQAILAQAVSRLEKTGATIVIGPIDGSTWRSYRLITERGTRPPFFLELDHPDDWPDHFSQVGFTSLATYFSSEVYDLTVRQPKYVALEKRLVDAGTTIRTIDPDRFDEELARVHELSLLAFANNYLYSPIDLESFLAMYTPIRERLVPELVLLAENGSELLGFAFGIPDLLQAQTGERVDTMILKTLAVRPGRAAAGLGGLLMEHSHLAAHAIGMTRAIHALMHETNKSLSLSSHYGKPFRRYTLFSKRVQM